MSLKIGDWVLVTKPAYVSESPVWVSQMDFYSGKIFKVKSVDIYIRLEDACYDFNPKWLSLVSGPDHRPETISTSEEITKMSAAQDLRSAKLTPDDRLAQSAYIENPDGTLTTEGTALLNRYMWDANRTAILAAYRDAKKTVANEEAALQASITADKTE